MEAIKRCYFVDTLTSTSATEQSIKVPIQISRHACVNEVKVVVVVELNHFKAINY